jgi:hypothetical protein
MGSGKLSNMEKLIITAKPRNGDFKVCFGTEIRRFTNPCPA